MAETNTMDVIFVDYFPNEPEDAEKHRVTLKEFLALPQDQLAKQNQKSQKVLGQLYKLNDREPPLFLSFPKREVGPLVIDCTPITNRPFGACYVIDKNKIKLVELELISSTELSLLRSFAHELKHAEQFSEELCSLKRKMRGKDGLAYHQLGYLEEAQAYSFGGYVAYLAYLESLSPKSQWKYDDAVFPILERHAKGKNIDAFSDIECEMIKKILPVLYNDETYYYFDLDAPISNKDKGLTEEEIPASFRFKDPREAFSLLKGMPQYAREPLGRSYQILVDHSEICEVINKGSTETLKRLVQEKLKSGEISSSEILQIIKGVFTKRDYSLENAEQTKKMLSFFLDLKKDGKPLMQRGFILTLLSVVHMTGRKDVEDAAQEYQKAHPRDKRFPENKRLQRIITGRAEFLADIVRELEKSEVSDENKQASLRDRAYMIHRGIKSGSIEYLKSDIKLYLDGKLLHPGELLEIVAKEFTRPFENYSDERIKNSKEMLDYFLNLQVNGKHLMQEKDISDLLKGARASGRKDVEEALLAYKAEHSDDKRFSENMFDLNIKDKVAEFVKRQERKAAEVEAAAKNAAKKATNKGVSALTAAVKAAKSK